MELQNETCTGLAKIVGQPLGSKRDLQSNCWAKSRNLGQPVQFSFKALTPRGTGLPQLKRLRKLTLHGNPVADQTDAKTMTWRYLKPGVLGYRNRVLTALPPRGGGAPRRGRC